MPVEPGPLAARSDRGTARVGPARGASRAAAVFSNGTEAPVASYGLTGSVEPPRGRRSRGHALESESWKRRGQPRSPASPPPPFWTPAERWALAVSGAMIPGGTASSSIRSSPCLPVARPPTPPAEPPRDARARLRSAATPEPTGPCARVSARVFCASRGAGGTCPPSAGPRPGHERTACPLLGPPMDRDTGSCLPGIERTGFEPSGRVPLPLLPDPASRSPGRGRSGTEPCALTCPSAAYQAYFVFHNQYHRRPGHSEDWGPASAWRAGRPDRAARGPARAAAPDDDPSARAALLPELARPRPVRIVDLRPLHRMGELQRPAQQPGLPGPGAAHLRAYYGVRWVL
jgi:hypothetical protein